MVIVLYNDHPFVLASSPLYPHGENFLVMRLHLKPFLKLEDTLRYLCNFYWDLLLIHKLFGK